MMRHKLIVFGLVLLLLFSRAAQAKAAALDPWQAGDQIRQALFDAQVALLSDNVEIAQHMVAEAQTVFTTNLRPVLDNIDPELAQRLDSHFAAIQDSIANNSVPSLAVGRGRLWAGLMQASMAVTLRALENNDALTAQQWLLLRDFRTSTKFSRPNVDATLAVANVLSGTQTVQHAINVVRTDLLDTYQTKLNEALRDADQASERHFAAKQAEMAGLAAGYFDILSTEYLAQRNQIELTNVQAAFATLVDAAVQNDLPAYRSARLTIDSGLKGFRAAPLSEKELARRAGQLTRFIGLVPVEYGRGVRDGKVVHDIEIQEATTFREGAWTAFVDLQSELEKLDPANSQKIADLFKQLEGQIASTAAPADVEATTNTILALLKTTLPAQWQTLNSDSDFDVIRSILDQLEIAVKQGEYAKAESARLEAYAVLDSGIEQKLRGFAPETAFQVESLFWQGQAEQPGLSVLLAQRAPSREVKKAVVTLKAALQNAEMLLGGKSAPTAVAGNAAIIVFREGLEAVLILASLVASLRGAASRQYRRPIFVGAALALAASALTWWIANGLLTLLIGYGERLEAIVSLIAIGVLLVITNWFFHKVYWTGWMANFHAVKGNVLNNRAALMQWIGLIVLGFSSIYREGFETVLFLQSLVLDAGLSTVLLGVAIGLVGVAIVGLITFTLQVKLPYRQMLIVTGVMIGGVLLMMVGNTVHVMQAVGWLPITPIDGVFLPYWMGQWFGVFATWQGIGLQVLAATFVIGSYFWAEHLARQNRNQKASSGISVAPQKS